ncbi:MAG: hypothetical protein AMXMBFR20_28420 [Planctomycetia bacterium]
MNFSVNHPEIPAQAPRANPDDFPLTEQDFHELSKKRGLSPELIKVARLGSVRSQSDLDQLGVTWPFSELRSTIAVPSIPADDQGTCLIQLHKCCGKDICYPLYSAPASESDTLIITESPLKALAVRQLGFNAVGLNGIHGFVNRVDELADACRASGCQCFGILLDTTRDPANPAQAAVGRDEPVCEIAYAVALEARGIDTVIACLPEKYLARVSTSDGSTYLRGDIGDAVAAGMTREVLEHQLAIAPRWWDRRDVPVEVLVRGWWLGRKEAALADDDRLKKILDGRPVAEIATALSAFVQSARSLAFDAQTKQFRPEILESLESNIKKLFGCHLPGLKITTIRQLLRDSQREGRPDSDRPLTLADQGLCVVEHGVFFFRPNGESYLSFEAVSNFEVQKVCTGEIKYLDGMSLPVHRVTIHCQGAEKPAEIEVVGSIYDPKAFEKASGGTLTVVHAARYKGYLAHRIAVDGIQIKDASLHRTLVVGACLDDQGKLTPSDGVDFPGQREECHYHGYTFAAEGEKRVFGLFARLMTSPSVAVILLFVLGAVLKPLLGWAFPHMVVPADSGAGKSTIADRLRRFFGILVFSGPYEFGTQYRARKLLSNSLLPIGVEEIGRVHGFPRHIMIDTLNQAYNLTPSTYGHLDKRFCLCTPAMLFGQDFGADDVALQAKIVIVPLRADERNPAALRELDACESIWPMRDWVTHACGWANARNLLRLLDAKADMLRIGLGGEMSSRASNLDRLIRNYATLLVVADMVAAFGIDVNVDAHVLMLLREHLGSISGADEESDRSTIARQFIIDLVNHVQSVGKNRGLIFDWNTDGLFIVVQQAFDTVRQAGSRFDITDHRRLRKMLIGEKLGEPKKHRFDGVERRSILISANALRELGVDRKHPGVNPSALPCDPSDGDATMPLSQTIALFNKT